MHYSNTILVYLVDDRLGIKKKQLNGGIVLQVGYALYVEPENTKDNASIQLLQH